MLELYESYYVHSISQILLSTNEIIYFGSGKILVVMQNRGKMQILKRTNHCMLAPCMRIHNC